MLTAAEDGATATPAADEGMLARTARGAGWVIAWRLATRVLGLCSTLALVRLLAPGDFGLVALAAAFAAALDVCLAIGVEDQIVRSRTSSRAMWDTAFTLNLARGVLVALMVAAAAVPAAWFFGDARMRGVLLALAVSAVISSLTNVGVNEFRRDMAFHKEFRLNLLPRLAGILVTVSAAALLRSHWALVLGILTNRVGNVVMSYVMHPYRPRLSLAAWRGLAGMSAWTWALAMTSLVRDRSDSGAIGRTLGATDVGIYAVGLEIATLPTTELVEPLCRACMPGFAETLRQGSPGSADAFLQIVATTTLLILPMGVGLSLVAGPVVALGFGAAWSGAAPLVSVLGVACTLTVFGSISGALLNAHALLRTILLITLGSAILRVGLLLALLPLLGVFGAALAVGASIAVEQLVLLAWAMRELRLRAAAVMRRVWRPTLAAAAMAGLLWAAGLGWGPVPGDAAQAGRALAQAVPMGAACYALAAFALWTIAGRPPGAEADLLAILRRLLARARGGLTGRAMRVVQ